MNYFSYLTPIIFLFFPWYIQGQNLRYAIEIDNNASINSVSELPDETLEVVTNYDGLNELGVHDDEALTVSQHLRKYDLNGKLLGDSVLSHFTGKQIWLFSHLISAVYDKKGNAYTAKWEPDKTIIEKKSPSGRPLWRKAYSTFGVQALVVLKNGEVWVSGCEQMSYDKKNVESLTNSLNIPEIPISSSTTDIFWIHKMNDDGQTIDFQVIEFSFHPDGTHEVSSFKFGYIHPLISLKVDQQGNTYLYGHVSDLVGNSGQGDYIKSKNWTAKIGSRNSLLVKMDKSGEIVFSKIWDVPGQYIHQLKFDGQGNSYLIGTFDQRLAIGKKEPLIVNSQQMFLAKFFSSGELLWQKAFGSANLGSMVVSPKGHIYMSVRQYPRKNNRQDSTSLDQQETNSFDLKIGIGALFHFDENGAIVSRRWVEGKWWSFNQLVPIDSSGFLVKLGYFLYNSSFTFDGMSFDKKGNRGILLRYDFEESSSKPVASPTPPLQVFPNTSPDRFQLSLGAAFSGEVKLSIADATGRTILQRTLHKEEDLLQTEVDLGRFAEGNYVLYLSDGWETASKKLVVRR